MGLMDVTCDREEERKSKRVFDLIWVWVLCCVTRTVTNVTHNTRVSTWWRIAYLTKPNHKVLFVLITYWFVDLVRLRHILFLLIIEATILHLVVSGWLFQISSNFIVRLWCCISWSFLQNAFNTTVYSVLLCGMVYVVICEATYLIADCGC